MTSLAGPLAGPRGTEQHAEGLSTEQAEARLAEVGPNEPVTSRRASLAGEIARRFANPLVAILLVASVLSAVLRDVVNAAIIVAMLVLGVVLELVQSSRSHRAAERLRDRVAPTATVLRDGAWTELPRRDVVPGDLVRVSAGDLVPADAEIVEANDLHVQEAALTGESLPAEKHAKGTDDERRVLLGSSVVSGTAVARVTATGARTMFGDVARAVAARKPQTELERSTNEFGAFIMKTVVFLVLFVFATAAAFRRDALDALLFAVALAVGLTPEFLPMITTVTLSKAAVRMSREKVIVKNLAAIQHLGSIDVLCSDKTGTLTTGKLTLARTLDAGGAPSDLPWRLGYVTSAFETGVKNPFDAAILAHAELDIEGETKVDEMPFDFERRRMSVVAVRDGERVLITKGAPEHVLAVCTHVRIEGEVRPLDGAARAQATATFEALGAEGIRVLAVATASPASKPAYTKHDEHDLVLVGFLGFEDPPRQDAAEAIATLAAAGVQVKILTGDSDIVARDLCRRVGIDGGDVIVGSALEKMTDPALARLAESARVFARVTPAQKNRIVAALRTRGHVVGYLGDGINDAPALHTADVGVSVDGAADVAKDAADVILLEHHLDVLHAGVMEGRRAFGNVMKYLLMGTSSAFGNMFSMAAAYVVLPFVPMLPTQILLNNFLYDLAQITIPTDNVEARFLQKPRRWDVGLIRRFMLVIGPVSSIYDFLTFWVLLRVFHAPERLFHTGWFVESLATQTLVIFVIRVAGKPFENAPSKALAATAVGTVLFGALLPFGPLAPTLGFVALPLGFLAFVVFAVTTYLLIVQLVKSLVMRRLLA